MKTGLLMAILMGVTVSGQTPLGGRVVVEGGGAADGLQVVVHRVDAGRPADETERDRVTPGANGAFQTKGLAAGRYAVCVGADAGLGLVDPCEWRGEGKEIVVGPGVGRAETVTLKRGTRLRFRLADPQGLLRHPRELGGAKESPLLGVFDDAGFFHMAKVYSVSATEQVWMVAVPKGKRYQVHFSHGGKTVADVVDLRNVDVAEREMGWTVEGKR